MTDPGQITITANGRTMKIGPELSLVAFLESRGQAVSRVVVEYNGQALTQNEALQTRLADGDRLEIVRIVAGG